MDEIASNLRVDPVQFRLRYLTSDKRTRRGSHGRREKSGLDRSCRRPRSHPAADKATGRGIAVANRANTMIGRRRRSRSRQIDRASDRQANHPGARLRLDRQSRWAEEPDRRKHHAGGEPRAAGRGAVRRNRAVKNLDWKSYPVITFEQIPEVEIVLINRPEMPPLGGGEAFDRSDHRRDRQCHFRCDRRALAAGSVHAAARAERASRHEAGAPRGKRYSSRGMDVSRLYD